MLSILSAVIYFKFLPKHKNEYTANKVFGFWIVIGRVGLSHRGGFFEMGRFVSKSSALH